MSYTKIKRVEAELTEDKAKRDASYEYSKKSKEPVAEGAFKGALASGLSSRFVPKKTGWKGQAANLAAGVIGGGVAGKMYNDKKANNAEKAKKWLSSKNSEKEYGKKITGIYKKADVSLPQNSMHIPNQVAQANSAIEAEKKKGYLSSAAVGGGLGGLVGGLMRFKKGGVGGAIGGAVIGAAGGLFDRAISSKTDKMEDSTAKTVGTMGATAGATAAAEPLANRAIGAMSEKARASKNPYGMAGFMRRDFDRYHDAEMGYLKDGNSHMFNRMKGYGTIKNHLPFMPGATNDQLDYVSGGKGVKSGGVFKGVGKSMARKGGKWALGGLLAGYGMSKLTNANPDIEKQAELRMNLNDAVSIKDHSAKKDSNISIPTSILTNSAKAATLYAIGRYGINSPSIGKALGIAGGIYALGSVAGDINKKRNGSAFLGKSQIEKKDIVVKDYNRKKDSKERSDRMIDAVEIIGSVGMAKSLRLGETDTKKKKRKKYSFEDDI